MIHLFVQWYERNPDFSANYYKEHHGTIEGKTAGECMSILIAKRRNHDIIKYTAMEILYIY